MTRYENSCFLAQKQPPKDTFSSEIAPGSHLRAFCNWEASGTKEKHHFFTKTLGFFPPKRCFWSLNRGAEIPLGWKCPFCAWLFWCFLVSEFLPPPGHHFVPHSQLRSHFWANLTLFGGSEDAHFHAESPHTTFT